MTGLLIEDRTREKCNVPILGIILLSRNSLSRSVFAHFVESHFNLILLGRFLDDLNGLPFLSKIKFNFVMCLTNEDRN